MTSKQSTVIWLGLVLVALNVVIHLADIKSVLFGGGIASVLPTTPAPKPTTNPPLAPGQSPTPPNVQIV